MVEWLFRRNESYIMSRDEIKKLGKQISKTDPGRLNAYLDLFDKILLYNLAANMLPPNAIDEIIKKWEENIRISINSESTMRTDFLESSIEGRLAKKSNQPDGEQLRLNFLETLDVARNILLRNLKHEKDGFDYQDPNFS